MIHYTNGNLLNAPVDYICHQVNCQGRMGSGIAKAIRDKWPIVYNNYMAKFEAMRNSIIELCGCFTEMANSIDISEFMLGDIQIVGLWEDYNADEKHQSVINMFAQQHYGYDGERYTSYEAFWKCLHKIKESVPKGSTIGFPDHIGCGLGGANWEVIRTMIEEVLGQDFEVYIYKLEEEK